MGLVSVCGVAAAPTVPAVTPPLFCPVQLLCPLLLHFVCSGSNCILSPFSAYRIPGCFFHVFTHAVAPAAPPSLPQHFPLAAAAPCALWCGSCCFACCSFSGCGSSGFLFLHFPALLHFLLVRIFSFLSFFHHFVPSGFVGGFLHSGFCSSSASVPFLSLSVSTAFYGDSASFRSPVPFAAWSPFGTSQILLRPLFLSLLRVASGSLFYFCMGFRSVPVTHLQLRFP